MPRSATPVTREQIRDALAAIPPDVDRDTWARVGMAVKSELGSDGFDLWNEWSARGESYDAKNARDTWKSIKAGGKTTIGTLFGVAGDHGYKPPRAGQAAPAPSAASQAEAARLAEKKQRQRQAEEADYRRRADKAARDAADMWASASPAAGAAPYLQAKGISAHGVRALDDGTLLVPLRDAAGQLLNLQRIAADGQKRFLPGGRKSGLWHLLGDTAGARALLVAEGYATAATLHEAAQLPVVVAFDAGNLRHVAKALREALPTMPLLVCGDDDRGTAETTGKNPGRTAAAAAVRAAAGAWAGAVFPEGLEGDGTDFNDLAQQLGMAAVRRQVETALAGVADSAATARGGPVLRLLQGGKGEGASPSPETPQAGEEPPGGVAGGDGGGVGPDAATFDPFTLNDGGVWHTARDAEGNPKRPAWLCAPLRVTARTRTEDANGWGVLLEFLDPDGNAKTWAMPSAMLSGDGAEWAGRLRDMGLTIAPGTKARNLVAQYIDTRRLDFRVVCTDRVGWHGPVYVLPSGSIASPALAAEGRRYVFQSDTGMEDTFRRHGTLDAWRESVAALAAGNTRLMFAVCCALAGPMLRPAGMESGGFHFRGESSLGKTTALKVAASVWGRPTFMQRWRTTDNALEATAVQHSDCTLILDEFGQLDPRVAGECAYMLANEQEKGRATRGGMTRRRRTWRLLFLSSGEVSLADHMAEAGKRTRAGMEVRMVDVPLDAGAGMGGIEEVHGHDGAGALADAIVAAAARNYGAAGRAWLDWACEHFAELPDRLLSLIEYHRGQMVPEAASEQVRRVGSRFALVAAAGELAGEAGITGWKPGDAARAVRQCFNAWLGARGHLDNGEEAAMLRQVRRFLELNGEGRFAWWHRAMDDRAPKTLNRAGFRRLLGTDGRPIKSDADHQREFGEFMSGQDAEAARVEFIVLREVFEGEVCQGFDSRSVARVLLKRGHLQGEGDRLMDRQRLPGMGGEKVPCYHVKPSLFADAG